MILKGSVGKRVVLRNECAVADEPARLGPQVNVGSLLSVELVVKPTRSSSRGVGWSMTHHGGVGLRLLRLLPSCKNGFRRVIPDFGPFDEQISSFFFFFSLFGGRDKGLYTVVRGSIHSVSKSWCRVPSWVHYVLFLDSVGSSTGHAILSIYLIF